MSAARKPCAGIWPGTTSRSASPDSASATAKTSLCCSTTAATRRSRRSLKPTGSLVAAYLEDTYKPTDWLQLRRRAAADAFRRRGHRECRRARAWALTVLLPQVNWILRGFWGKYYQAPPLTTLSGPLLEFAQNNDLGFMPLHGERDEEYQFGLTIPLHGWTVDVDHFHTQAKNFFDHNNIGNSNAFLPLTIDGALIQGNELTIRSPAHLECRAVSPGLFEPDRGWHRRDQRRTDRLQPAGGQLRLGSRPAQHRECRPGFESAARRFRLGERLLRIGIRQWRGAAQPSAGPCRSQLERRQVLRRESFGIADHSESRPIGICWSTTASPSAACITMTRARSTRRFITSSAIKDGP